MQCPDAGDPVVRGGTVWDKRPRLSLLRMQLDWAL